jgi:hypothetical protein
MDDMAAAGFWGAGGGLGMPKCIESGWGGA